MKKFWIGIALTALLTLTMSITVFAAQEIEANDTAASATAISLESTVYGNIAKSNDVDWYKFTVYQTGYFYVDFDHELIDSTSRFWNMRLYDSTAQNFIDGNNSYFSWTGKTTGATSIIGVDPGTYYIKVARDSHTEKPYNFTVRFTASVNCETENNSSKDKADTIKVNETYRGSLSTDGDVDWYKFTVPQDGYFYVDFNHELIDSGSRYWYLRLYDSTGVNFIDGNDSYFYWTGKTTGPTNTFGIKAGTYYLRLNRDSWDGYSGIPYDLTVKFTPTNNWEKENNNKKDSATGIMLNETYQGSLSTNGDVDWYKFTISEKGVFDIDFTHELIDSYSSYWCIKVYDSTGVNFVDGNNSYFSIEGNSNGGSNSYGVEPGIYYFSISKYSYDYSGLDYNLKVNFTPADDWESENNSERSKADRIEVNKVVKGALSTNGDVDWYTFDVSSPCEVAVTLDHEVIDSSSTYWYIYLYDGSGVNELLSFGRKGNTPTGTTDYVAVSSGTYYVKIAKSNYSGLDYSMVVAEKHDCKGSFVTTQEPTCTKSGKKEKLCDICGKLIDTQIVPANGHTSDNWVIDQEATCTSEGKRHSVCGVCGETVTGKISPKAHTLSQWTITREATCGISGSQTRSCSVCGHTETGTLAALTHEYGEWEIVSGNKLIPPIVKEKTCAHCADVQSLTDWSYVWVTIVAGVVLLGVLIGVINYARAFKNR